MFDKVNLKKLVSAKNEFESVVDTQFRTFTNEFTRRPNSENILSIEEFFENYENLYLEIPIKGTTLSHEYLINKSTELAGESKLEQTSTLMEEVNNLRNELVQAYQKIEELESR